MAALVGAVVVGDTLAAAGNLQPLLVTVAPLWPTRSPTVLLDADSSAAWSLGVIACAGWTVCGLLLALQGSARGPTGQRVRVVSGPVLLAPAWGWRKPIAGAVAALLFGLVVPSALRPYVPWYLRPQWVAEVAGGRASADVTRLWLSAVQDGQTDRARALAAGTVSEVAGPLTPQLSQVSPASAYVDRSVADRPDVVTVTMRDGGPGQLYVCLVRDASLWRVRSVRTQPDCPLPAEGTVP